jgi:recombination protein RecT
MSNLTVKKFFDRDDIQSKFNEMLGTGSKSFLTSLIQTVGSNSKLAECDPVSIYQCAAMGAALNLQINQNIGEAYIIPYGKKAQFQLGYKGLIQLAIRSNQYKKISTSPIYAGQLISDNPLTGFEFDFTVKASGAPIGYAAYFILKNDFEKTIYVTKEQVTAHAKKFSKTFDFGPWKTDFDPMALKTVLKSLINTYGPKSLEMISAISSDQAVINDFEKSDFSYPDNEKETKADGINQEFDEHEEII